MKELTTYLHGALPPVQQEAMNNHLASCDACALMLQESKALEAELIAEALAHRPLLSPEASLRIQERLYRRLRRSLAIQRTWRFFQMTGAFIFLCLFFAGAFLLGNQWLHYLAAPATIDAGPGRDITVLVRPTASTLDAPLTNAVPGSEPESANPIPAPLHQANIAEQSRPDLNSPVTVSVTPGQQPAAIAQEIVATAMSGNFNRLNDLFIAMRTARSPAVRIWRHLAGRCMGALDTSTLHFEAVPENPTLIARVDIYQDQRYAGEIKMRLIDGEWFTVFVTYPAITGCSGQTAR